MGGKDLYAAVSYQNYGIVAKIVEKIVSKGGKSKKSVYTDEHGLTCVHKAALIGNPQILETVLQLDFDLSVCDTKGNTPIHYAAYTGSVQCIEALLGAGSNPAVQDNTGITPLHITAREGHGEACQLILQTSPDSLRICNKSGKTAIDFAAEYGKPEVLRKLLQQPNALTLLQAEHDQNDPRSFTTPLHLAAANGHVDCMKLLLQYGFDVNKETPVGTALHDAAVFGKLNAVQLLIENGIDVFRTNQMEETALDRVNHLIANKGGSEIKELLQNSMSALKVKVNKAYRTNDVNHLKLSVGDVVTVVEQNDENFWRGTLRNKMGFFPKDNVEVIPMRHPRSPGTRYKDGFVKDRYSSPMKPPNITSTGSDKELASIKRPSSDGTEKTESHSILDFNRFKMGAPFVAHSRENSSSNTEQITEAANKIMQSLANPNTPGASDLQILEKWLTPVRCEQYAKVFIDAGHDVHSAAHMSGADLAAVGVTIPADRASISEVFHDKVRYLKYPISPVTPRSVNDFLRNLNLQQYEEIFQNSYKTVPDLLNATIEDLMEIGIEKLGHQKRILIYISEIISHSRAHPPTIDEFSTESESRLEVIEGVESPYEAFNGDFGFEQLKLGTLLSTSSKSPSDQVPSPESYNSEAPTLLLPLRMNPHRLERPISSGSSGSKGSGDLNAGSGPGSIETLKDSSLERLASKEDTPTSEPDPFQNIVVYPGQSIKRQIKQSSAHVSIDPITAQPVLKSESQLNQPAMPHSRAPGLLPPSLNPRQLPLTTFSPANNGASAKFNWNHSSPEKGTISTAHSISSLATEESEDAYVALPPPLHVTSPSLVTPTELPPPPPNLLAATPTDDSNPMFFAAPPPPLPKRSDSLHVNQTKARNKMINSGNFFTSYYNDNSKLTYSVNN